MSRQRALLLLLLPALAAGAEVALVNGTAEADQVQVYADGSVRLSGNVKLHAERLGPEAAVADVTADTVTAVVGTDKQGKTTMTKLFAAGKVHLVATTTNPAKGEKRRIVSDCHRVDYVAAEEVVHLRGEEGKPVTAHVTVEVEPTAENKRTEPETYTFDLTAREVLDYRLSGSAEDVRPGT